MVDELSRRIAARYGEYGVERTTPLIIAVSGGVDSVVATHLTVRAGFTNVVLLWVNHNLRGAHAAADERRVVYDLGCRFGLLVESAEVEVGTIQRCAQEGGGVELAARHARYRAFEHTADRLRRTTIVLAHHRDDQVENLLIRMVGGHHAHERLLIPPERWGGGGKVRYIRPLLSTTRAEIASFARAQGIHWVEDASNADPTFRRNAIRAEIVPSLRRVTPAVETNLLTFAHSVEQLHTALEHLIPPSAWGSYDESASCWRVARAQIAPLPPIAQEIVLRRAVYRLSFSKRVQGAFITHAVARLGEYSVEEHSSRELASGGDVVIATENTAVVVKRRIVVEGQSGYLLVLSGPVSVSMGELSLVLRVESGMDRVAGCFSSGVVEEPVVARDARGGDRMAYRGRSLPPAGVARIIFDRSPPDTPPLVVEDRFGVVCYIWSTGDVAWRDGAEGCDESVPTPGAKRLVFQMQGKSSDAEQQ